DAFGHGATLLGERAEIAAELPVSEEQAEEPMTQPAPFRLRGRGQAVQTEQGRLGQPEVAAQPLRERVVEGPDFGEAQLLSGPSPGNLQIEEATHHPREG